MLWESFGHEMGGQGRGWSRVQEITGDKVGAASAGVRTTVMGPMCGLTPDHVTTLFQEGI